MSVPILDDIIDFLAVFPYGSLDKLKYSIKFIDNATFNIILTDFKDNKFKSLEIINPVLIREFVSVITNEYNERQSKILSQKNPTHVVKTIISPAITPRIPPTPVTAPSIPPTPVIITRIPVTPVLKENKPVTTVTVPNKVNIEQRIIHAMKLFVSSDGWSDISLTLNFLNKNNMLDLKYSKYTFIELLKSINKFKFNKFNNFFKLK
jgi:hypothetical protein